MLHSGGMIMKRRFTTLVILVATFLFTSFTFSQGPSKAQVIKARQYFSEKGILRSLVDLTKADSEQATRFSDVITACYDVFQIMDQISAKQSRNEQDLVKLEQKITELQVSLGTVQNEDNSLKITEDIVTKISKQLKTQVSTASTEEIEALKGQYNKIDQQLSNVIFKVKENEKTIQKYTIISISSAIFTCMIGLLAAL